MKTDIFPTAFAMLALLSGCAGPEPAPPRMKSSQPVYETSEQLRSIPPCRAVVTERAPCYAHLQTTDGKGFYLGSPGAAPAVGRFVASLEVGHTCELPRDFRKFLRSISDRP